MKNLTKTRQFLPALLVTLACVGAGCERNDLVRAYEAPKEPPPAPKPAPPPAPIMWTVPSGWKELPGGQMRYAAFAVSQEHPEAVLTVIPLPPSPLLANVNRWEGQLGLPPSQEKDLDKVVRHLDLPAGHVDMVELLGPEKPGEPRQRMLGAIIEQAQQMWFFKLAGPDPVVSAQKEAFEAFIRSVSFTGAAGGSTPSHAPAPAGPPPPPTAAAPGPPSGADPHGSGGSVEKPVKWTAPPEWVQDPQPRTMRALSFRIASGERGAEVAVIRLPGSDPGQVLSFINIWRQEAGLQPVQNVNMSETQRVTIAGRESLVFDFPGPESPNQKRVVVAMSVRGPTGIWFFKLFGDAQVVAAQKDAFQKFITSVEFGG